MSKAENAKLIDSNTDHFRVLNFININLDVPIIWQSKDYDEGGNKGISFYGYEEEENLDTNIGYIMIIDTTDDETELDITKMSINELKDYNDHLEKQYRNLWGEQFVSWRGYETSKTNQGIPSFLTKCVINEYDAGDKFDFTMRTTFNNRTIFASAAVREYNLFFMKYYKSFKNIIDNITFEEI